MFIKWLIDDYMNEDARDLYAYGDPWCSIVPLSVVPFTYDLRYTVSSMHQYLYMLF